MSEQQQIRPIWGDPDVPELGAWLHIARDGEVTVFTGKAELGQGSQTSLTQVVAEELRVSPAAIRVVLGDTALTPFDMGTFGSRTTPVMVPKLRQVAATARELLIDLAAKRWDVNRTSLVAIDGRVVEPQSGQSVGYGELTGGRRLTEPIRVDAPLTPAEDWTVAGNSIPKVDAVGYVTGQHRHASDVTRPGMLYGRVLRPPTYDSTLTWADTSAAEAIDGVVVARHGSFVGVAASDRRTADQALSSIRAEWSMPPQRSSAELFESLRAASAQSSAEEEEYRQSARLLSFASGDLAVGRAEADYELRTAYTVAYVAHSPLEPRAALAEWSGDELTVWAGTSRPFGVAVELAAAFGLDDEKVRVIALAGTASYGGKHTGECALEAARLAQAAGRPVKCNWNREEEFAFGYVRPACVVEIASAVRSDGTLAAWEHDTYGAGVEGMRPPYEMPNQRIQSHPARPALRSGSYRALAAPANHFARETHLDELAKALELDPLELRLRNLREPRLRAVFEAAAEQFGWGTTKPVSGHGYGLAGGTEKASFVATCVEVAVDPVTSVLRLVRIVEAFECGAIINRDGMLSQAEGAIVQAIGGALFEHVEFENGRLLNGRFSRYRVPRFSDVPPIEIVLLDRKDLISVGGGETPLIAVAPAIGNAIFAATGVRLRGMPLLPTGVVEGAKR